MSKHTLYLYVYTSMFCLIQYKILSYPIVSNNNNNINNKMGQNLFTSEGNLRGGLGSRPFMITPTR